MPLLTRAAARSARAVRIPAALRQRPRLLHLQPRCAKAQAQGGACARSRRARGSGLSAAAAARAGAGGSRAPGCACASVWWREGSDVLQNLIVYSLGTVKDTEDALYG